MEIRQAIERREESTLSSGACLCRNSRGRTRQEEPCPIRTAFQVDRDRILHCKAFRRLKYKTQVFLSPEGDHYRTRLTHTLEVAQIARTMARALSLNEDLTEAIALGHDLGHTPFGHAGERTLAQLLPGGFHHVRQSLRVVETLEKDGAGLNLTWEVRDGILRHSKGRGALLSVGCGELPATREGQLVRLADVIAYVNHDLDDAIRAGLVRADAIPLPLRELLGHTHSSRINTMVRDIITSSAADTADGIRLSPAIDQGITELRDWLYCHVYQAPSVEADFIKASRVLRELFGHFMACPDDLVSSGGRRSNGDDLVVSIADFLAGMTDRYAISLYGKLFLPQPWRSL